MTSPSKLKRDLEVVQRALDVENRDDSLELDWERVPEHDKGNIQRASEILSKYARLNGFLGGKEVRINLAGITASEETELTEGAQLFNKYAEPDYVLRRERRGRWRPIH